MKKKPLSAVEEYLSRLTQEDMVEIEHYAMWLHQQQRAPMSKAWIEAIINRMLKRGLLKTIVSKK